MKTYVRSATNPHRHLVEIMFAHEQPGAGIEIIHQSFQGNDLKETVECCFDRVANLIYEDSDWEEMTAEDIIEYFLHMDRDGQIVLLNVDGKNYANGFVEIPGYANADGYYKEVMPEED